MALSVKTGTYTGNASNRSITGVGFQPKLVIVMTPQTTGGAGIMWAIDNSGTPTFGENGAYTISITSLDADGFSLGTSDTVNKNSTVYHYIAFGGDDIVSGTYTGNGSDNRNITGIGFQPVWVIVQGDVNHTVHKMNSTGASSDTAQYGTEIADLSNAIQALNTDGFQIGTDNTVNANTKTYRYACFKSSSQIVNQSYTGNGSDNRDITTTGITPVFVAIKQTSTQQMAFRTNTFTGDSAALARANTGFNANIIQLFATGSFQIGTHATTNNNGSTYHSIAIAAFADTANFFALL